MSHLLFQKCLAEFLGAFAIVFFGCGYVAVSGTAAPELTPIVFGATVSLMIYGVGHLSGAHFNPAVTLGFASVGRFPWKETPYYIGFQVLGGILAATTLAWILPHASSFAATVPSIPIPRAFAVETLLTFFLMFIIISVATDSRAVGTMAGIAIGFTVTVGSFLGGSLTGASMNPARTLGPALLQGEYTAIWIYLVAPPLGALLAARLYEYMRGDTPGK